MLYQISKSITQHNKNKLHQKIQKSTRGTQQQNK